LPLAGQGGTLEPHKAKHAGVSGIERKSDSTNAADAHYNGPTGQVPYKELAEVFKASRVRVRDGDAREPSAG